VTYSWKNNGWVSPLMKGQENFAVAQGWQDWDVASKYMSALKPGLQPCSAYLEPASAASLEQQCDASPPGGKFVFRQDSPIGAKCTMTRCKHTFQVDFQDASYALGLQSSCCTHADFSQWSNAGADADVTWSCTLARLPNGSVGVDCWTGNESRWRDLDSVCNTFKTIPSTPNCPQYAPDQSPGTDCPSCCCTQPSGGLQPEPVCVPNFHAPQAMNCPPIPSDWWIHGYGPCVNLGCEFFGAEKRESKNVDAAGTARAPAKKP
jgi:hypothetical protein